MERAEKTTDMARSSSLHGDYFEIIEPVKGVESNGTSTAPVASLAAEAEAQAEAEGRSEPTSMLEYASSKCPKRQVVHVQCRSFKCGLRPRTVQSTRARYFSSLINSNLHISSMFASLKVTNLHIESIYRSITATNLQISLILGSIKVTNLHI